MNKENNIVMMGLQAWLIFSIVIIWITDNWLCNGMQNQCYWQCMDQCNKANSRYPIPGCCICRTHGSKICLVPLPYKRCQLVVVCFVLFSFINVASGIMNGEVYRATWSFGKSFKYKFCTTEGISFSPSIV